MTAFAGIVIAMVVVTVAVALWIAGSPATERARRLDGQRQSDLQAITFAIDAYYARSAEVPTALDDLRASGPDTGYSISETSDPVTKVPYEYRRIDAGTYELCAVFDLPSESKEESQVRGTYPITEPNWDHAAGRHCFTIDAEVRNGRRTCSLTNPCDAGQNCVTLPAKTGSFCVPTGKECAAAECPNNQCVIAESYPAQVRCVQ